MIGYCCINKTLRKKNIYTNRSLIRKTFSIEKCSDLILKNTNDLLSILEWNKVNGIMVFRISSGVFPRITDPFCEYNLESLSNYSHILKLFDKIGSFAQSNNMILSCHPGPFTVLGSKNENVVKNSIKEIIMHYGIKELLNQSSDNNFNINFHIGSNFSIETADIFCKNFEKLPEKIQKSIIIENDDKCNGWSVSKLYNHIYSRTGIPITFDYHHSFFSREPEITIEEEFNIAKKTWKNHNGLMEVHVSESDNPDKTVRKHSKFITKPIPLWLLNDKDIYILFETKEKELSVMYFREKMYNVI